MYSIFFSKYFDIFISFGFLVFAIFLILPSACFLEQKCIRISSYLSLGNRQ
jgi:hypothetical protein